MNRAYQLPKQKQPHYKQRKLNKCTSMMVRKDCQLHRQMSYDWVKLVQCSFSKHTYWLLWSSHKAWLTTDKNTALSTWNNMERHNKVVRLDRHQILPWDCDLFTVITTLVWKNFSKYEWSGHFIFMTCTMSTDILLLINFDNSINLSLISEF